MRVRNFSKALTRLKNGINLTKDLITILLTSILKISAKLNAWFLVIIKFNWDKV